MTFVDVVGFTLEKIHVGVVAWLLDTRQDVVSLEQRRQLLHRLSEKSEADRIRSITAHREFAPSGRRKRIDLVLEMALNGGAVEWLVVEFKTDSEFDVDQLTKSWEAVDSSMPGRALTPISFCLGASQAMLYPPQRGKLNVEYEAFDLKRTRGAFGDLIVSSQRHIYSDWIQSLDEEIRRVEHIEENILEIGGFFAEPHQHMWKRKGYRPGIPLFFLVYDRLRGYLNQLDPTHTWCIYSGRNNPVMNLDDSWTEPSANEFGAQLCLELNWDRLVLKAQIKNASDVAVRTLRERGIELGQSLAVAGRPATRRPAKEYISIFSWQLPLANQSLRDCAAYALQIIDRVQPELHKLVGF